MKAMLQTWLSNILVTNEDEGVTMLQTWRCYEGHVTNMALGHPRYKRG